MYVGCGVLTLLPPPFPSILVHLGKATSSALHAWGNGGQSGHDLPRDP